MPGNPEPSASPSPSPSPAHAVSGEDVAAKILVFCSFVAPEQLSATRHAIRRYAEAGGRPAVLLQRFAEGCPRWDWGATAAPPAMPDAAEEAGAPSREPSELFQELLRAGEQRAVFPGDRASAAAQVAAGVHAGAAANPAPPSAAAESTSLLLHPQPSVGGSGVGGGGGGGGSSVGGSGKRARFTDVEGGSAATPALSQGSGAAEATGLPVAAFSFADVAKLKLDGGGSGRGGGAVVAEFGELQASEGATTVYYGDASFRQDEAAEARTDAYEWAGEGEGEGVEGLQRTATFHAPQEPLPGMEREMRISRIIEQAERTRIQQQVQQQELEQQQMRQQQQQQQQQQQRERQQQLQELQREELQQRQQQQQQLQEQLQRQQQEELQQQQQQQQLQQEADLQLEQDLSALLGTPDVHTAQPVRLPADSDAAAADLLPPPPPADVERSASFASDAGFAPLPSSSGQESEAVVISDSEDDAADGVADAFDGRTELAAAGASTPAAATPFEGDEAFPFPTGPQPAAPIHSSEPQPDAGRRKSQTPLSSTPATPRPAHAQVITMADADAAFAAAAVSTPEVVAKVPAAARPLSSSSSSKVVQHLHSQLLHKQRTNWHLLKDREDRLRSEEEHCKQRQQQQQQRYQHQQQRQQQQLQQRRSTGNPLLQRTTTTATFSAPSVTPALLSPLTRGSVFEEPDDVVAADAFDDDVPPEYPHDAHHTPATAPPPAAAPASSVATNAPPAFAYEYEAPLRGSSADSDSESSASTCDTTTLVMEIRGLQSLVDREARRGRALRTSAHASLRATRDGAVGALCATTVGGPATPPVFATMAPPPHASGVGGGGVRGALDGGGFGLSGSKQLPPTDDVSLRLPFTPFVPSRLRATPRPPSFPASPPPMPTPLVFPPGQQHVSLPRSKSYLNLPHTGGDGSAAAAPAPATRGEWAPRPRMKPRTLSPPPPPPPPPAAMTAVSAAGTHGMGRRRSSLPCTTSLKSPELRGDGGGGGGGGGVRWLDSAGPSQTAILTALPVSGSGPGGVGRRASLLLSRPQHASRTVSPPRNPPPAL